MKTIKSILLLEDIDSKTSVNGWINTSRIQTNIAFISINDGSCQNNLQIVIELSDLEKINYNHILKNLHKGVCVSLSGKITKSPCKGQNIEIKSSINDIKILGNCDPNLYPLSKKRHSLEFIRKFPHLRVRTNLFGMMSRIRNTCIFATHTFFQNKGYINIHTPLITSNDCEGAGETFTVTNLLNKKVTDIPKNKDNTVNFKKDFFGKKTFLTVSGQLQGESYAMGLSKIYTFGPTFRAEKSNTSRHLSEFWMIEPEAAFIDYSDLMCLGEDYIKFCVDKVLENNIDDVKFIDKRIKKNHSEFLKTLVNNQFKKISYTKAIEILKNDYNKKSTYDNVEEWGCDLNSEQEKYLTSKYGPVIIYDYPKKIKSFYMKSNKEGETVQAMDILVPGIGEIIGGSMREENYDKLLENMNNKNIKPDKLKWYLDLRKFGSAPHGGFGLGFERLIMLITGISNIKDCIHYPRYLGNCIC